MVQPYYAEFVQGLNIDQLLELLEAANFMGVKQLMALTAANFATRIKGKSTEEMREILKIEDDLTDEDRARLEEEKDWFPTDISSF